LTNPSLFTRVTRHLERGAGRHERTQHFENSEDVMNFPRVIKATAFDRHNVCLRTITFEGPFEHDAQKHLHTIALNFRPDKSVSQVYLCFTEPNALCIKQRSGPGRLLTKDEADQLLEALGISIEELPSAPTTKQYLSDLSRQAQVNVVQASA